jgi:hypothetical protein
MVDESGMAEKIFLTLQEAVDAVCADFRQYDPQLLLFGEIARLITGRALFKRDSEREGAWIRVPGGIQNRWMEAGEMVEYMCGLVRESQMTPELLASICRRVFRAPSYPHLDRQKGITGIFLETGMEDFSCRQCGRCCLSLVYHDDIGQEDVARWQALGRSDILAWVGVFEGRQGEKSYRIWTDPGTGQLCGRCPFLERIARENRWVCRIHDVKPAICRQYPMSRKHALMTGCMGFAPAR